MIRRSIILTFILLFGCSWMVRSQEVSFGVNIGIVDAGIHESNVPKYAHEYTDYHPIMRFHLNAHVGYALDSTWKLSVEPGFLGKGAIKDLEDRSLNEDPKYRLDFVQLPVLIEWHFNNRLYISGGPELAYLVEARSVEGDDIYNISHLYDKRFDLSAELGIHYAVTDLLHFGLAYNHALTPITSWKLTDVNGEVIAQSKEYTRYLQISVGLEI